jgi:hypothetical protein
MQSPPALSQSLCHPLSHFNKLCYQFRRQDHSNQDILDLINYMYHTNHLLSDLVYHTSSCQVWDTVHIWSLKLSNRALRETETETETETDRFSKVGFQADRFSVFPIFVGFFFSYFCFFFKSWLILYSVSSFPLKYLSGPNLCFILNIFY